MVIKKLRRWFANCGGINRKVEFFAGNLAAQEFDAQDYIKICFCLIFPNGTRKTTQQDRNASVIDGLDLNFDKSISILDVGASIGVDALSNYEVLKKKMTVHHYTLGDLYTEIQYDKKRGLVFDQDGHLLQVRKKYFFVNIYFEYKYNIQKLMGYPQRIYTQLLKSRYTIDNSSVEKISMIHPKLISDNSLRGVFSLKRMNVFEVQEEEKYDLIFCFHLLIQRYFSQTDIDKAVHNLVAALNPGGVLVYGERDDFHVVRKT